MQLRGLLLLATISHNISATSASQLREFTTKPQQKPKTNSTRNEKQKTPLKGNENVKMQSRRTAPDREFYREKSWNSRGLGRIEWCRSVFAGR
jgi:hypothetical protein